MPDPTDPTPVRVVKRGGKFVVVDRNGSPLAKQEPFDDSVKAKAAAARVNATWRSAKTERKSKGGPALTEAEGIMYRLKPTASAAVGNRDTTSPGWFEHPLHAQLQAARRKSLQVQEAWSPASRIAALAARREHGGGGRFNLATNGSQLNAGEHFMHHDTHYKAEQVMPHPKGGVVVHARVVEGGPHPVGTVKKLHFVNAADHPKDSGFQRQNIVHVRESLALAEDWSPQARAAALAARRAHKGTHGPAAGLAAQRHMQPYAAIADENVDPHGIDVMHYDPEHGSKKSSQTHVANIARHVARGHGKVILPSGVSVRMGPKHYVVRSASGQEKVMKNDTDIEGRARAAALALRTHRNGGEFPKGLGDLKHGGSRRHLFHALLADVETAARADLEA